MGMADDPENEEQEKGFLSHFFLRVAVVFGVLAIYVLSIGPVYKIGFATGHFGVGVVYFYMPVWWLCQKSRFAEHCLSWYLETVWGLGHGLETESTPHPDPLPGRGGEGIACGGLIEVRESWVSDSDGGSMWFVYSERS
jgi:hypothetical protein